MNAMTRSHSKPKRKRMRVTGVGFDGQMLTREGVMRVFGLGAMSLMEARKTGIVKALMLSGRAYYRSSEIIRWIEATAAVDDRSKK